MQHLWYFLFWILESIVSLFRWLLMGLEVLYRGLGAFCIWISIGRSDRFSKFARKIARYGIYVSLAWVVLVSLLVYVLPKFWPHSSYVKQVDLWKTAEIRTLPVQISDQAGRYVGFLDSRTERDFLPVIGKNVTTPVHTYIKGEKYPLHRDHKSVNLIEAPEKFWQCLRFLEDRHLGSWWRNPNGVDLLSTLMMPVSGRGGSTIPMQVVRSLNKDYAKGPKKYANRWEYYRDTVSRKSNEMLLAPILMDWLYDVGGEQELARWSANHIAIIQGGYDYDVVGVGAASRVLFGKPASDLTTAEQYLLAAAVILPFDFILKDDGQQLKRGDKGIDRMLFGLSQPGESEESYNARRDGRAMRCNTELTDMEQRLEVESELLSLLETPLRPYKDNDVADAFAAVDRSYADKFDGAAVHPERVATFQLEATGQAGRGPRPALLAEIRNRYGKDYRKVVDRIQITLDIPENIIFTDQVNTKLSSFEDPNSWWCKGVNKDGSYYLIRKTCDGSKPNKAYQVLVTMAVADEQGRIVRFFSTDNYSNYFGANRFRDKEKGNYNWKLENREIASVAKVAAALLLADGGHERLDRPYSNDCVVGLPNKRGCYPNGGPETVLPEKAFGSSLSHAIIHRLKEKNISPDRIDEFMTALGFSNPKTHQQTSARTRLALGQYGGSPQAVHGLMRYAMAYMQGNPTDDLQATTMIHRPYLRKDFKGEQPELIMKHPGNNLITPGGRTFVRKVLEAPICASNGTLQKLRKKWCAANNPDVRRHIAKTGTRGVGEGNKNDRDWWITGGVELANGRVYTYVLRVGSDGADKVFFKDGAAGKMADLIEIALESLL